MRRVSLNDGWSYRHATAPGEKPEPWQRVTLPHDAMILEPRSELAPSGRNGSWFAGRDYEYVRHLFPGPEFADKTVILELEGAYHLAEVWVDGELVAGRPCGYLGIFADLTEHIRAGHSCNIRVVARNSDQPNSRWYTGAGLYRPAALWVGERAHIEPDGICVSTLGIDPARVSVDVRCAGAVGGQVQVELRPEGVENAPLAVCGTAHVDEDGHARVELPVPGARLWSPADPALYACRAVLTAADGTRDEAAATFGIRSLEWGDQGLLLNGERLLLKGACIHHDNGVLGACAWPDAERRKVALMREQGYNALRSAHNPCSKALLDACDHLGMLVVDEYADQWYTHKTQHDYAEYLDAWWQRDLADMVAKDKNHPCVVMYSIGNEVSETAEKRGIELARRMTERLHALDSTRPVTCGINIFFNFLSSVGFGQYSDEKAAKEAAKAERLAAVGKAAKKHRAVGSEFFNNLAGVMGADFMKRGAALPFCDRVTRDAYAALDIAGYNYGIERYRHDLRVYPHRLILGTETFCSDAYRFMQLAAKSPHIVGDFVWSGMDYLGEAGVGAWEYEDYAPKLQPGFGWLTAGAGRVDLTGKPLGEAFYTRVALGADPGPYLAVCPVNHTGDKHSPSAWKMSNAIDSWSWDGCDGREARVEVYARAAEVVLVLNGREVARRRMGDDCIARMSVTYEPGVLEAVSYDADGVELGRRRLVSAGDETRLVAEVEYIGIHDDLRFIRVRYADAAGVTKPLARGELTARVEGARLLGFGCAAPYNEGSFVTGRAGTYYGEALAVVQATGNLPAAFTVTDGTRTALLALS